MDKELYIQKQLEKHMKELKEKFPDLEVLGIWLQGSQNYGLDLYTDDYKSDVDTKAIIIPKLDELIKNSQPFSYTYILPNNEHIDIKDIRLMFNLFKKQNINFLEILFTDFYIINPKYKDLWENVVYYKRLITCYNKKAFYNSIYGMALQKQKALCHPYPSLINKIEKYGYDGKQLSHIIRLYDFVKSYSRNSLFGEALKSLPHKEEIMKAKLNKYSLEEAKLLAEIYCLKIKDIKDFVLPEESKKNVEDILDTLKYSIIEKNLKDNLKESD